MLFVVVAALFVLIMSLVLFTDFVADGPKGLKPALAELFRAGFTGRER